MCQLCGPDNPTKGELTDIKVYNEKGCFIRNDSLWLCEKHAKTPSIILTQTDNAIYWTWLGTYIC